VLNAKGGEIKAKANGSANHLWISKTVELESLCLIKTLLLQKMFSYGGIFYYGKKGEFVAFDQISNLLLKDLSICQNKCVGLRDRKKNLFCEN
jgi:hypothetical protein